MSTPVEALGGLEFLHLMEALGFVHPVEALGFVHPMEALGSGPCP